MNTTVALSATAQNGQFVGFAAVVFLWAWWFPTAEAKDPVLAYALAKILVLSLLFYYQFNSPSRTRVALS